MATVSDTEDSIWRGKYGLAQTIDDHDDETMTTR